MNQQAQQFDLNSLFMGMLVFFVVLGMTRTMGHFFEPPDRSRKSLPKPVARVVTVPGGSHWLCAKCGIGLEPGSEAVKIGAKAYCVECARGGNPNSTDGSPEEQVEKVPLSEEFEEFIRGLPFMPEKGKPLPDYVYQIMKPEFVTSIMEPPMSEYGRELLEKVALDAALFLKGGDFEIVEKLVESGWSSEDVAYDTRIRHKPTASEWDMEVWAPFEWRKPETYSGSSVIFLPTDLGWEFYLTMEGGMEASRAIEELARRDI